MNYLSTVILFCVSKLNGERSINAVYYLLNGKKSSQTIQDAVGYDLKRLFSIFPELTKEQFHNYVQVLNDKQLLIIKEKSAHVTESGKQKIMDILQKYPIPSFLDGWNYHDIDRKFWQRLSLVIQTTSNWLSNESKFLPVQRDLYIQRWVKQWLFTMNKKFDKQMISKNLFHELTQLFLVCENNGLNPTLIVTRLSGYQEPGLTAGQIAKLLAIDETYYILSFRSFLHFIISIIWNEKQQYPFLYSFVADGRKAIVLTESTRKTLAYLNMEKSIEEIAMIRKLKKSTIEDHIVEIALMDPTFSIDPYVSPKLQQNIRFAAKRLGTRKLKAIKEQVQEADYFSIRLVLAKWSA